MFRSIGRRLFADGVFPRLVRVGSVFAVAIATTELVDRFFPGKLPSGWVGFAIFSLVVCVGFLTLEVVSLHQEISAVSQRAFASPAEEFAKDLGVYARSLSECVPPQDRALLDLRRWCSRLLHLNGSHVERAEIGQLALGAAASMGDDLAQASILIDDLGWGLHASGDSKGGRTGVVEGVLHLDSVVNNGVERTEAAELRLKGLRHLVTIDVALGKDVADALQATESLVSEAEALPEPARSLHLAQLKHLSAALVSQYLADELGPNGVVDSTGEMGTLLVGAIRDSQEAEVSFGKLGDVERQVKSLRIHVDLLRRTNRAATAFASAERLKRLETRASRQLT